MIEPVSKVKRMEAELAKAREETKQSIIASINAAIADLAELGYAYVLTGEKPPVKTHQRVCKKCGKPGHNSKTCTIDA